MKALITNFPMVGETSVNELLDLTVTNSTMAKLARKMHRFLPPVGEHDCAQVRMLGGYWPQDPIELLDAE